VNSIEVESN